MLEFLETRVLIQATDFALFQQPRTGLSNTTGRRRIFAELRELAASVFSSSSPLDHATPIVKRIDFSFQGGQVVGVLSEKQQVTELLLRVLSGSARPHQGTLQISGRVGNVGQARMFLKGHETLAHGFKKLGRALGFGGDETMAAIDAVRATHPSIPELLGQHFRDIKVDVIKDLELVFFCNLKLDVLVSREVDLATSAWAKDCWHTYLESVRERGVLVFVGGLDPASLRAAADQMLQVDQWGELTMTPAEGARPHQAQHLTQPTRQHGITEADGADEAHGSDASQTLSVGVISPSVKTLHALGDGHVVSREDVMQLFHWVGFLGKYLLRRATSNTVLGPWWLFIRAALPSLGLLLIFQQIDSLHNPSFPHALHILSGMLLWSMLDMGLGKGVLTFQQTAPLRRAILIPWFAAPLASMALPVVYLLVSSVALVGGITWFWVTTGNGYIILGAYNLLALAAVALAFLLTLSLLSIVAMANTVARDVRFSLPPIRQLLFLGTPILYSPELLSETGYHVMMLVNPMAPLVEAFRWGVFGVGSFEVSYFCVAIVQIGLIALFACHVVIRAEKLNSLIAKPN